MISYSNLFNEDIRSQKLVILESIQERLKHSSGFENNDFNLSSLKYNKNG